MKRLDVRILIGVLLIGLGGLAMLDTMGCLQLTGDWFFGVIFVLAGAAFLYTFAAGTWWAALPGMGLLGLAGTVFLPGNWSEMAFLLSLGIGFWLWYLARREFWWAIILGGLFVSISLEAGLDHLILPVLDSGIVFFLGLAGTFALVAWLTRAKWVWWLAAGLTILGLLVGLESVTASGIVWGILLIGVGGYLILRTYRQGRSDGEQ